MHNPILGLTIKTSDGVVVYGANTRERKLVVPPGVPGSELLVRFRFPIQLIGGDYFISVGLADDDEHKDNIAVDRRYDLIHVQVRAEKGDFGIAALNLEMSVEESQPGKQD